MNSNIILELTKEEKEYIWLLTSLDAMRIYQMAGEQQDYHYQVRHSLREKLYKWERLEQLGATK